MSLWHRGLKRPLFFLCPSNCTILELEPETLNERRREQRAEPAHNKKKEFRGKKKALGAGDLELFFTKHECLMLSDCLRGSSPSNFHSVEHRVLVRELFDLRTLDTIYNVCFKQWEVLCYHSYEWKMISKIHLKYLMCEWRLSILEMHKVVVFCGRISPKWVQTWLSTMLCRVSGSLSSYHWERASSDLPESHLSFYCPSTW